MHRSPLLALSCFLAIVGLSACDRAANETASLEPTPEPAVAAPQGDSASMRYRCEGGYGVAVIGDTARVTTSDGREIDLRRVADRSPPLFAGEALEFSVESDGAVLGQDEGGPFPCREAD